MSLLTSGDQRGTPEEKGLGAARRREEHVDVLLSKDVEDHIEATGGNEGEHHCVLLRSLRKLQYES